MSSTNGRERQGRGGEGGEWRLTRGGAESTNKVMSGREEGADGQASWP